MSPQEMNEPTESTPTASFAKGTYVTLWPKVEKCHNYVSVLLAAQEQLQETVDRLIAGLKDVEQAEAQSLVGYADRVKAFPSRVERLQEKLERIESRLIALKASRNRAATCAPDAKKETTVYASPLF